MSFSTEFFFGKVVEEADGLADQGKKGRFSLALSLARARFSSPPRRAPLLLSSYLAWFSSRLCRPSQTFGRNRGAG